MRIPEEVFDEARKILDLFLKGIDGIGYQSGGILTSELLLFCACCELKHAQFCVESGRRNGYSTRALLKMEELGMFKAFSSIEIEPDKEADEKILDQFPSASLVTGDSRRILGGIKSNETTAVLMDGPKGPEAVNMIRTLNPVVGAVHDLHKISQGDKENVNRKMAEEIFPEAFFSDQEDWLEEFGHLDEHCLRGEYSSREEMTKYGFTLMVRFGDQS